MLGVLGPKKNVRVNLTPDGLADSVKDGKFVYPLELEMTFSEFYDMMSSRKETDAVPYLSEQNDNFRSSFYELINDVPSGIPLARGAFDADNPEAVRHSV